jgi:hypothetical protein
VQAEEDEEGETGRLSAKMRWEKELKIQRWTDRNSERETFSTHTLLT